MAKKASTKPTKKATPASKPAKAAKKPTKKKGTGIEHQGTLEGVLPKPTRKMLKAGEIYRTIMMRRKGLQDDEAYAKDDLIAAMEEAGIKIFKMAIGNQVIQFEEDVKDPTTTIKTKVVNEPADG